MSKRILLLTLLICSLIMLAACGGYGDQPSAPAETPAEQPAEQPAEEVDEFADLGTYTLKFANWFGETHPQNIAINKFAEDCLAASNGHLVIEVYPNCQLGSEDVYIDSVKEGTVEMGATGTMMAEYCPGINVAECPFLFQGWEHAQATLGGEIGLSITEDLVELCGVRCLAWTANGFRVVSSNQPITSMEDFQGVRLRVPNTSLYIQTFTALGVNPIAMALSEVYTALETGVADGQDNPYATDRASSFYEVQTHILETNHMFSPIEWLINEEAYQALPTELREILDTCIKDAAAYEWQVAIESEQADKDFLVEQGMIITECTPELHQQMVDAVTEAGVYDWLYEQYPGTEELAEQIRNYQL